MLFNSSEIEEEMTTEKDSTQKEESLMLEVVSLQGLSGQWKLCTKLSKMMNIPESCLREKDIVQVAITINQQYTLMH